MPNESKSNALKFHLAVIGNQSQRIENHSENVMTLMDKPAAVRFIKNKNENSITTLKNEPAAVSCGEHYASDCSQCPYAGELWMGEGWCNGDCQWRDGACMSSEADIIYSTNHPLPYPNNDYQVKY